VSATVKVTGKRTTKVEDKSTNPPQAEEKNPRSKHASDCRQKKGTTTQAKIAPRATLLAGEKEKSEKIEKGVHF